MEQRLSVITLGVADLGRSTAFYEALGWRRPAGERPEGVTFFQANGLIVALFPREHLAEDIGIPAEGSGFCGLALAYNTRSREEVEATLKEAEAAGGRIIRPAAEAFWGGYSGYFADPDGFPWEIAWNPDFALDAGGGVSLPG